MIGRRFVDAVVFADSFVQLMHFGQMHKLYKRFPWETLLALLRFVGIPAFSGIPVARGNGCVRCFPRLCGTTSALWHFAGVVHTALHSGRKRMEQVLPPRRRGGRTICTETCRPRNNAEDAPPAHNQFLCSLALSSIPRLPVAGLNAAVDGVADEEDVVFAAQIGALDDVQRFAGGGFRPCPRR